MTSPNASLEGRVAELQRENQELRDRLAAIEGRDKAIKQARKKLLRGGWRIMLPLVDRQRVVRSFSTLVQTLSDFSRPRAEWPTKDEILVETREFMESYVRFAIRRRTVVLLFSILAFLIPIVQIALVFQQNEIIKNQNELAKIQVYDIASSSMAEGDRNARQMTGALLATRDFSLLKGVVEEAFAPDLMGGLRTQDREMAKLRLEDAAFRSHLIRAVVRGVQRQEGVMDESELYEKARPMFRQILRDADWRMPGVLWFGAQDISINREMTEQVDYYFTQMGRLLSVDSRLSRAVGREGEFYHDARPLFARLSGHQLQPNSRFAPVYKAAMQDFLFDLAMEPDIGEMVSLEERGLAPEKALDIGFERLRKGLGDEGINWSRFKQQVALQ